MVWINALINVFFAGIIVYYFIFIYKKFSRLNDCDSFLKIKDNKIMNRIVLTIGPISLLIYYFITAYNSYIIRINSNYKYRTIDFHFTFGFILLIILYIIFWFTMVIRDIMKLSYDEYNKNQSYIIDLIISIIVTFIVIFAFLNKIFYIIYPYAYDLKGVTNWFDEAFEFLYYSFCVGVTLNSGSIEPIQIVSKLLYVFQIIVFYYVIGQGLFGLLSIYKINKSDKM